MKKTYTRKQITEAIAYWKKQLRKMNEAEEFNDGYLHLKERLSNAGLSINDIKMIYCGWDHFSRNSGGDYYNKGTPEFNKALKDMLRDDFEVLDKGDSTRDYDGSSTQSDGVVIDKTGRFMNIPWNSNDDMCYCLYF